MASHVAFSAAPFIHNVAIRIIEEHRQHIKKL
jgi:hypothetical protein